MFIYIYVYMYLERAITIAFEGQTGQRKNILVRTEYRNIVWRRVKKIAQSIDHSRFIPVVAESIKMNDDKAKLSHKAGITLLIVGVLRLARYHIFSLFHRISVFKVVKMKN